MKTLFCIIFLVVLVSFEGKAQSECNNLSEGISFYNSENFDTAIKSFKIAKSNTEKGDKCYIQSCLWLAKCYYYLKVDHIQIGHFLGRALKNNDIEALRFYALDMSYYNSFLESDISMSSYLEAHDPGEVYFLFGNIYAKKPRYIEEEVFQFLEKSLAKGFSGSDLFSRNYLRKANPMRYDNITGFRLKKPFELNLKFFVEQEINHWQKKGKFEKTATYKKRVNEESRSYEIERLTQQYIDSIGAQSFDFTNAENDYDADNEVFKITFKNLESIYLPVPINDAKNFDSNFKLIVYEEPNFTFFEDKFELIHLEIINPAIDKRYIYDSKELVAFSSSELALNFDKVDIELNSKPAVYNAIESSNVINVGKSDVDKNIPNSTFQKLNCYALIIGNEDYTQYQSGLSTESNVDFAISDAISFSNYCEITLGIPKENIVLLTDAISSQMRREVEKLMKLSQYSNGEAEIIFYYAGHGFPDEKTKESYLMPVDISGTEVTSGIKISELYSKLTKYPAKKVSVFLDACFSGGGRNNGLLASRGVKIVPKANLISGNLVVFSASTGEQSSLPYHQKQHGMFTYFLLKKLQLTEGNVTYGELSDYIKNQVQLNSVKVNNKDQNPQVLVSPDVDESWRNWKFIDR